MTTNTRHPGLAVAIGFGFVVACIAAQSTDPIAASAAALGSANLKTLVYNGFGSSYSPGQSPTPAAAYPRATLSAYKAEIDYDAGAMRVDTRRQQAQLPPRGGGEFVFNGERRETEAVAGTFAWNVLFPSGNPGRGGRGGGGAAPVGAAAAAPAEGVPPLPGVPASPASPQGRGRGGAAAAIAITQEAASAADAKQRALQIWMTPHGFLKAAVANHASTRRIAEGVEVSFTLNGSNRFTGLINSRNEVQRVSTWTANSVLGDMLVETDYYDYVKTPTGVSFPMHITQRQGGHPTLDLYVTTVEPNAPVDAKIPDSLQGAKPATPSPIEVEKIATGVYYLRGGTYYSVAVEMADHVVLIEAPVDEARSLEIISSVAKTIPNKPIRFVVNTHHHFDHAGGLRTLVDAGATVVTHQSNKAFYEGAWAAPRTLSPDRLSTSRKVANFQTFADKVVLTDGSRTIEVHTIAKSPHAEGFAMVYLPSEKLLIEADAYTPAAVNASAAPARGGGGLAFGAASNPLAQNLYDNIARLKLDVAQIAPLHGSGVVAMGDLAIAAGRSR